MNNHLTDQELSALHDGQVSAVVRAQFMGHVSGCPSCASRLAEIGAISRTLTSASLPVLSQIARTRVRRNVLMMTGERSLIHLAELLSGLAAAVLIGGLVWLSRASASTHATPAVTASVEAAPPWIDAPTPAVPKIDNVTNTPAARWYLADTASHVEEAL